MRTPAKRLRIALVLTVLVAGWWTDASSQEVTFERLLNADKEANNWLSYFRDYRGWRYSPLKQINTTNVKRLVPKWIFATEGAGLQLTPLVVDGVMYLTNSNNDVLALNAATGAMLWRYQHELPDNMPSRIWGRWNRGVSIIGNKLIVGTMDAQLIALEVRTGKPLWKVKAGDHTIGEGITSPPIIVKDKAIVGVAPLEFGSRGFVAAYNTDTGEQVWRFYTVPGPGEPGHDTWGRDSWKYGGAAPWIPGTYDPRLNLVFFGTGNPVPMFLHTDVRPGDNLYSDSLIALDAETGRLRWHFQHVPHDLWDLDSQAEPMLVELEHGGRTVSAVIQAHKNGYLYAFDRESGRLLYAKPYAPRITWTRGLDDRGRPRPHMVPTPTGGVFCPSFLGAKNWNHAAYNPLTGYLYIPTSDVCSKITTVPAEPKPGVPYLGGELTLVPDGAYGMMQAVDIQTGTTKWQHRLKYPLYASALTTAGGLVFAGDPAGAFHAFDAQSGDVLWQFSTGPGHRASPITYSVGGRQYIAVPTGWAGPAADLLPGVFPEAKSFPRGSTMVVFGLFEE
jgi:alcohol dehydrogenase (cytochrome c)